MSMPLLGSSESARAAPFHEHARTRREDLTGSGTGKWGSAQNGNVKGNLEEET